MYYLTLTTLIHIYLIKVYCKKRINISFLNIIFIFIIIILKVIVFKLLVDPFNIFIFAWFFIFILAQILIGKNVKQNLELSFLIELINVLAYYICGGIILITTQRFDVKDIVYFRLALNYNYIPFILITTSMLLCFGIFRKYVPLEFSYDSEEKTDLSNLLVILAINLVIKIMYDLNVNYGIKLILFSCINVFIIIFYIKNKQLNLEVVKDMEKLREKEKIIDELSLYIETIEELVDKFKEFRHDCKNMLIGIGIDNEKVGGLIDKVQEETEINENYKIFFDLKDIKYSPLKSLLYYYIMNAFKEGIDVKLIVIGIIHNIDIADIEFSRVVGILLENALESAAESRQKQIEIYIEGMYENLNITIGNTYKDTIKDIEELFNRGFSTKGENRGMGLYILKTILEKNNRLKLETYTNEEFFIQDIYVAKNQ